MTFPLSNIDTQQKNNADQKSEESFIQAKIIEPANKAKIIEPVAQPEAAEVPFQSQQTILIDEYEKNPTREFESLGHTVANIIKNSHPRFTIGIYGEWGTGKTTLMKAVEASLNENISRKKQKIIPVWFNAWKYEREEHPASIAIIKTIGYAMQNHEKFDSMSKIIFKGLSILGREVKQEFIIDTLVKKKGRPEDLDAKIQFLTQLERNSIYFDGLNHISQEMRKIRESNKDYRIVVFIDDLDRCSSKKVLEVLESIKVFLDIEGFVYVIGLSKKTVTKLITQAYSDTGVRGEDYVKKIIQIPVRIPQWTSKSIIKLMEEKILPQLNHDYAEFLQQNAKIIAAAINSNPRQLKRFINSIIIAFETFASQQRTDAWLVDEIFLVHILKTEWKDFYEVFISEKRFREFVRMILAAKNGELRKFFQYVSDPKDDAMVIQRGERVKHLTRFMERTNSYLTRKELEILAEFDHDIWNFFAEFQDILFNIKKWEEINRITEIVEEIPYNLNFAKATDADAKNP
jgi:hypothetical protein